VADAVMVADDGRIASTNAGTGAAGQLDIQVRQLTVVDGGSISVSVTPPTANTASDGGGTLTITATDRVVIDGQNSTAGSTALFGRTTGRSQKPGLISVSAPSIDIKSSGLISTATEGAGQGGNIALHAGRLTLADGGRLTTSSTSTAPGAGDAGSITITADTVSLAQSRVATDSTVADGGNIQVQARQLVRLQDSIMTTAVRSGSGQGGNIRISSDLVVLERSQILANAFGGPGGNIHIVTQGFVDDTISLVDASSTENIDGIVDIQALTTFNDTVVPLPQDFTPASILLWERCAERLREGTVSSFVVRGRASLPVTYESILPSRLYEPQQPQTPATGVGHSPQKTTVSSQVPNGPAAVFSSRWLDLRCTRP
jgi:large exoprotein involved in heme utilization and adhesion